MTLTDEAMSYHLQLLSDESLMDWHHARGIGRRTIGKFCLGAIVEPLSREAGWFKGSPTIPYVAVGGKVIQLKVRRVGVDSDKYRSVGQDFPFATQRIHLFNAQQAMPSPSDPQVFIVEGEYDAMVAVQCGLRAVAVPGIDKFNEAWVHLFKDSQPVICMDGDERGQAAAHRLAALFERRMVNARTLTMPTGQDVTDLFLAGGRDRVLEVLQ